MSSQGLTRIISVKVETELADLLNSLPNKSEFIRSAILAAGKVECPLCGGCGVVFRGIAEHFTGVLERRSPEAEKPDA